MLSSLAVRISSRPKRALLIVLAFVIVAGTLKASADDKQTAKGAESAFAHDHDVTVGGPAVANEQINASVTSDLAKAELLAFPLLIILSLLFFRDRAALMPLAVGDRQ